MTGGTVPKGGLGVERESRRRYQIDVGGGESLLCGSPREGRAQSCGILLRLIFSRGEATPSRAANGSTIQSG